jgi:hypothetical protein
MKNRMTSNTKKSEVCGAIITAILKMMHIHSFECTMFASCAYPIIPFQYNFPNPLLFSLRGAIGIPQAWIGNTRSQYNSLVTFLHRLTLSVNTNRRRTLPFSRAANGIQGTLRTALGGLGWNGLLDCPHAQGSVIAAVKSPAQDPQPRRALAPPSSRRLKAAGLSQAREFATAQAAARRVQGRACGL